MPLVTKLLNLK